MNTAFILGGTFIFIIIAFMAGMFCLPELFGISKNTESETTSGDDESEK